MRLRDKVAVVTGAASGMGRTQPGMVINPRMGQPGEIAQLALFLESDEAGFINGVVVTADGGWTAY